MHSPGIIAFGEKPPGNLMRSDAPAAEAVSQSRERSLPLRRRPALAKKKKTKLHQTAPGEKTDARASQNPRR